MITIRQGQLEAFRAAAREEFVRRLATHVRECFPDAYASMGAGGVRELIHAAIVRAAAYGIATEYGVAGFVDLLVALGDDFDGNPNLPWARAILTRDAPAREKIDTLQRYALDLLGEDDHV